MGVKGEIIQGFIKSVTGLNPKADQILSPFKEAQVSGSMPRTPKRSIQGPVPEDLPSNPSDKYYSNYEEAVMNNSSRYIEADTGKAMQIRNYNTPSAPLGRQKGVAGRQADHARENKVRNQLGGTSTVGDNTFYEGAQVGTQAHHRSTLAGNDWMYEGLDDEGRAELAKLLEQLGVITGNSKFNRNDMPKLEHDQLHTWMRENGIEFAGRDVAKKIKDFNKMSPQQRMKVIETWIEFGQGIQDEKSFDIMKERKGVPKARKGRSKPK